ncbi:hypothetical protein [Methylobacillus sp.]|uniref:hypothetical protein n=1 Tax=Methylobacillus sp. TaxID=56818 RepID=UPI002FE0E34F
MKNSSVTKFTSEKKKSIYKTDIYQSSLWEILDTTFLPIPDSYQGFSIDHQFPFSAQKKLFGPLTMDILGSLFWLTARQQLPRLETVGFDQDLRPCFVNDFIDPVYILIWDSYKSLLQRYNPYQHTLETIKTIETELLHSVQRSIDIHEGKIILLMKETKDISSRYKFKTGKLWQDIHTIQGYLALAAEMLHLNYAPICISGALWISQLNGSSKQLHTIDMSVVGARYFSV